MMGGQSPGPLRIGLLGAARIAALAIVDPAHTTGDRLVAVAARDRRRAEAFAASHGVERVLDTYADVVADPEVEVVYNPLANGLHGPWNLVAIAAGKHVLTEKPSASNAAETREVRDAATAAGLTLLEGFHYLYHPVTRRLHELLATGELGQLRRVEVDMVIPAPDDDDPRWSLELAGGALMDLGCYSLHAHRMLAPWAGGPPRVGAARCGERAGHPGVDEWLEATWSSPAGRPAAPAATWPATASVCPAGSSATGARPPRPTSPYPAWTTGSPSPPRAASGSSASAPAPPTPTSWRRSGHTSATAPRCPSTPTTPLPPWS
jgi:predicted dehydrogenase